MGIEKSPDYKLNVTTPLFHFIPGKTYHIQAGSIDGHCFIFIDGKLSLEVTDPDPINPLEYGMIGFEAYCSHFQVKNLIIRDIRYRQVEMSYVPEF